jgi:hypothetical protein
MQVQAARLAGLSQSAAEGRKLLVLRVRDHQPGLFY